MTSTQHENQASIARWARDDLPGGPERTPEFALGLVGEAVRLAAAAGASGEEVLNRCFAAAARVEAGGVGYRERRPDAAELAERAAGVQIALCILWDRAGVDRRVAVDARMKVNRARSATGEGGPP